MWILYDFETSSRELIGQIISYAFWVVDDRWEPVSQLTGQIRLKPTEFPELDAILITKTRIDRLQSEGDSEYDASLKIYQFVSDCIESYGHCILAGYNASQFDLKFLRTTLIRNGINPYFMGKLSSIDILHYVQHVAMSHSDTFPWISEGEYWTFSLESVSRSHGLLTTAQAHDAQADVILMRDLIRCFETQYKTPLSHFRPVRLPHNARCESDYVLFKQVIKGTPPQKTAARVWYRLFYSKSDIVVVDVAKFNELRPETELDLISTLRYINCNTHFFSTEPLTQIESSEWAPILPLIDALVTEFHLTRDRYFELIKKPWDIEYRIHELGFERIDTLRKMILQLQSAPTSYTDIVHRHWKANSPEKDRFLIQLFNRFALNFLSDLPRELTDRYVVSRYIHQSFERTPDTSPTLWSQIERADAMRRHPGADQSLVTAYLEYAHTFVDRYELNRFLKTSA